MDISTRPAVVAAALGSSSTCSRSDAELIGLWLAGFCGHHGLWASGGGDLPRGLTGAAFPIIGNLYDRGASTLRHVPRWAAPVLVEGHPRAAASELIGGRPSRSLVAALASSLLPRGLGERSPALYPLALALMGRRVLAPDAILRILQATAVDPSSEPDDWPSIDDVARVRRLSTSLGPQRTTRLLIDAGTVVEGPALLRRTATLLEGMPTGARLRLPRGLTALHERCRELTPIDPRPRPSAPRSLPHIASHRVPRPAPRSVRIPRQQLVAPIAAIHEPAAGQAFSYSRSLGRLHGRAVGLHLRLTLPRTSHELRAWGDQLHSCVGSFAAAVTCGRSLLIGVERDDVLAYCAELTPGSRSIRQFHGPYNRAVPLAVAGSVCAVLFGEGLLDAHHPGNAPWLQASRAATAP